MTEHGDGHDRYAQWDGAYVLGALTPVERAEYEQHLADCRICQDAVADLAPLPGLLAHVDAETLDRLDDAAELPPADLEQRLLAAARPPFWRRTSTRVGVALAAAAAVVAAVVVPITLDHHAADRGVQLSLHSTTGTALPLSAHVALAPEGWGTRVDMTCAYAKTPETSGTADYGARAYALYVVDDDGHAERVSSWHSGPGEIARTTGSTELALGDITRVELRDDATDTVLLTSTG